MQCPKCEKEISTLRIDDYALDTPKIILKDWAKVEGNTVTITIEDIQNIGFRDLILTCPECHDYKRIYKHLKKSNYKLKWESVKDLKEG